jgi:hypothetical protein
MPRSLAFVLLSTLIIATAATAASKPDYERRMQSRIALFTPQCFSDDPATAQREKIARSQRAVRELEAIEPPGGVAAAHRRLMEGERGVLATLRKFLPRYERLSQTIRRARADGEIDGKEQSKIQNESQQLLVQSQPPRRIQMLQGSAFREFRRKGYDVMQKGPPKREYERLVQALVDRAGSPSRSFRNTTSASNLRAQLLRVRGITYRAARALGAITPRQDVINAQSKLVLGLCARARNYAGYAETLKRRDPRANVRLMLRDARDMDRILGVYPGAFKDYRGARYNIRPPARAAG